MRPTIHPPPITANSYLRTGYTFTGWNTVAGGTGKG